jgi:hypothetical protein
MAFDEDLGSAIVSEWLLLQMTDAEPPSAEDLYIKLSEAVEARKCAAAVWLKGVKMAPDYYCQLPAMHVGSHSQ